MAKTINVLRLVPEHFMYLTKSKKITYQNSKGISYYLETYKLIQIMHTFLLQYHLRDKRTREKDLKLQLHSLVLRKNYGTHYKRLIDFLLNEGFLIKEAAHIVGAKAITYRLSRLVTQYPLHEVRCDVKRKPFTELFESADIIPKDIQDILIEDCKHMEIDRVAAMKVVDAMTATDEAELLRKTRKNKYTIEAIASRDLYCKFDKYGRMHTPFSVLKREIRKHCLYLCGEEVDEVDMPNSQPTFLYKYMQQQGFSDWGNYEKDVLSGEIYSRIADLAYVDDTKDAGRRKAKNLVYNVFFGTVKDNHYNRIFQYAYPSVHKWICDFKNATGKYYILAHKLQRLESEFIYSTVIRRIKNEHPHIPLVTVHDSIMFPVSDKIYVERIFTECLNKLLGRYSKTIDEMLLC